MTATSSSLLQLLHLCDSLFPVGAFSHSDGLESAAGRGAMVTGNDLRGWMDVCIDQSVGRADGPAVLLAWRAFATCRFGELERLDQEVHALRPSSVSRHATRAMGTRLLKTWMHIRPDEGLNAWLRQRDVAEATLPVAFGVVCAAAGIDERSALGGYAYTRLAAMASAAMRLMAIGQHEAHALLAEALQRVPRVVEAIVDEGVLPGAFTPVLDIEVMSQQYMATRLFQS